MAPTSQRPSIYFFLRELGYGGTETYLSDLLPLLAADFAVHLVVTRSSDSPLQRQLVKCGIVLHEWPTTGRFTLAEARRLSVQLACWRPSIVHTVSLSFHALARAAAILAGCGALVADYRNDFEKKFAKRHYLPCEPALRDASDALLFASPALIKNYQSYWSLPPGGGGGLPRMEWHQGIRLGRFDPRSATTGADRALLESELHLRPGRRFVSTIARFHPQKRHDLFFGMAQEVAAADPRAEFLIIGDGELSTRQAYEAHVRALGIGPRVHFLGQRADIARLLQASDIFVLCSDYEGLSRSMLEAMASGVPVVVSQAAETTGTFRDGMDVAIVERQEPAAYARRVIEILESEPLQRRLSAGGLHAAGDFSIAASAAKLTRLYHDILNPAARSWRRAAWRSYLRAWPWAMHLQRPRPKARR